MDKGKKLTVALLASCLVLPLAACAHQSSHEESLAQCKAELKGPAGAKFLREFGKRNRMSDALAGQSGSIEDAAHTAFMATCMKLKGF